MSLLRVAVRTFPESNISGQLALGDSLVRCGCDHHHCLYRHTNVNHIYVFHSIDHATKFQVVALPVSVARWTWQRHRIWPVLPGRLVTVLPSVIAAVVYRPVTARRFVPDGWRGVWTSTPHGWPPTTTIIIVLLIIIIIILTIAMVPTPMRRRNWQV